MTKRRTITVAVPASVTAISAAKISAKIRELVWEDVNDQLESALAKLCEAEAAKITKSLTEQLRPRVRQRLRLEVDKQAKRVLEEMVAHFRMSYET